MEDKLHTLISYCEEEKARLFLLIADFVKEEEYLLAHFHSQALYQLNGKLQTLQNIDDNLFDDKCFLKKRIENLEKQLKSESSGYMKEYFSKELVKLKDAFEKLNQIPKQSAVSGNATILDEALDNLVEKRIKNLKFILKKTDNLLLEFYYSKKIFKIVLPYVKRHAKNWILHDDRVNSFNKLGFELTDNENRLVLLLPGKKDEAINKLKIILSKIVFEIFYFKEFENESYIQFTEKNSR